MTLAASTYPLLRLHRREEARTRLDTAFERLKRLKQYPAANIDVGSPAFDTLRALAEYEANGGNFARSAEVCDELIRLVDAASPSPEVSLEDAVEMSDLYGSAARIDRKAGRTGVAAGLETRRRDIWHGWYTKLPGNPFVRRQLEAARLAQTHPI